MTRSNARFRSAIAPRDFGQLESQSMSSERGLDRSKIQKKILQYVHITMVIIYREHWGHLLDRITRQLSMMSDQGELLLHAPSLQS